MASNDFDGSWLKPKTYVEAAAWRQHAFDTVSKTRVEQKGVLGGISEEHKIRTVLDTCNWHLPCAMAMLIKQNPTTSAIKRMAKLASLQSKKSKLAEQSTQAWRECATAQERAIEKSMKAARAQDRAAQIRDEVPRAEDRALKAEAEASKARGFAREAELKAREAENELGKVSSRLTLL